MFILSAAAYEFLSKIIENDGEFLPVFFTGQDGTIFNILKCAEDFNALDIKLSTKNEWGDLQSLAFIEKNIKNTTFFKCKFEGYRGLFCSEAFKIATENAKLNGVTSVLI